MKIWVGYEEWYPVFIADDGAKCAEYDMKPWGSEVEVTTEFYAEYERVLVAFEAMQKQLSALLGYED